MSSTPTYQLSLLGLKGFIDIPAKLHCEVRGYDPRVNDAITRILTMKKLSTETLGNQFIHVSPIFSQQRGIPSNTNQEMIGILRPVTGNHKQREVRREATISNNKH